MPTSPDIPTSHWEERACWVQAQPKLQPAVHCTDHCRLLAPMAHVAFILGTRLSVPPVVLDLRGWGQWGRISKSGADLHGTGYLAWCRMELRCLRTNSRCHHLLRDEDHSISPQTESPIGKPLICHIIRRKDLPTFCRISDILPGKFYGRSVPLHQPPLLRRTLQLEGNEHRNAGPQQHCGRSALVLILVYEYFMSKHDLLEALGRQPAAVRWSIYYLLAIILFTLGQFNSDSFIYLQF